MKSSDNQEIRRLLGVDGTFGEMIGLTNDWAANIIKAVGNYGEIFERNIGDDSPLKIARGLNALWTTRAASSTRRRSASRADRHRSGGPATGPPGQPVTGQKPVPPGDGGEWRFRMTRRRLPQQRSSLINDPKFRGIVFQVGCWRSRLSPFIGWIASNTIDNLQRAHIASGFGFLWARAGFDISQTLIPYSAEMTYGRAFLVGLLNTLLVAALGIVLATIIGFMLGIAACRRTG